MEKRILEGSLLLIKHRGLKFTMDDLAAHLGMSKKTIYRLFANKEAILLRLVDELFDRVGREQRMILEDDSQSCEDKLRGVMCVLPAEGRGINFTELYRYQDKYPLPYLRFKERIERDWEPTLALIEEGVREGIFRPVNPQMIKVVYEATVERLINSRALSQMHVEYDGALCELVELLLSGIHMRERE